jgi:hypothetical protein
VFPPAVEFSFSRAATQIGYSFSDGDVRLWFGSGEDEKIRTPKNLEASLRWLEIALGTWGTYKKSNPKVPIDGVLLEAVRNLSVDYLGAGKRNREDMLRGIRLLETTLQFCSLAQEDSTGKDYIATIKEIQGVTYYNLGASEWNGTDGPRNKSKAITWWKQAARAGCDKAKETLKEEGVKW